MGRAAAAELWPDPGGLGGELKIRRRRGSVFGEEGGAGGVLERVEADRSGAGEDGGESRSESEK